MRLIFRALLDVSLPLLQLPGLVLEAGARDLEKLDALGAPLLDPEPLLALGVTGESF